MCIVFIRSKNTSCQRDKQKELGSIVSLVCQGLTPGAASKELGTAFGKIHWKQPVLASEHGGAGLGYKCSSIQVAGERGLFRVQT